MKQLMGRTLTSLLLIVLWAAGSAYAQSPAVIRVNIPFEFTVGARTFPPGQYSLTQPLQHFVALRDARGQTIASSFTSGIESPVVPDISTLKFRTADGQYVLTEVWQQDDSTGQRLYPAGPVKHSLVTNHRSLEAHQAAEGSQP